MVEAADVVRVGCCPSKPEITSRLSICGGGAEEEGCGECIVERLAWGLREDDDTWDCEADPFGGDRIAFRLGAAEAKIVSNNEIPVPGVVDGEAGVEFSIGFLSIADANKVSRVTVAFGADG